jgi:hypothetical protein
MAFVEQIVNFVKTGVAPVPPEETEQIFAFLEAAEMSKQRHGLPVRLAEAVEAAK